MASTLDKLALESLVGASCRSVPSAGSAGVVPAKLRGDKGYDCADLRLWLCGRGITLRIARRGIWSSFRLGRHRWVVERTVFG